MGQAKWRREHGDDRRTTSAQDREAERQLHLARQAERERVAAHNEDVATRWLNGETIELTRPQQRLVEARVLRDAQSPEDVHRAMDGLRARGLAVVDRRVHPHARLGPPHRISDRGAMGGLGIGLALAVGAIMSAAPVAPSPRPRDDVDEFNDRFFGGGLFPHQLHALRGHSAGLIDDMTAVIDLTPVVPPDPEPKSNKGAFDGSCNRTACQTSIAGDNWYNRSTRAYYCRRCAGLINEYNPPGNLDWMTPAEHAAGSTLCIAVAAPVET